MGVLSHGLVELVGCVGVNDITGLKLAGNQVRLNFSNIQIVVFFSIYISAIIIQSLLPTCHQYLMLKYCAAFVFARQPIFSCW